MLAELEFTIPLPQVLTVPRDAVLDSGLDQRVFIARGGGYFEPRKVVTGRRLGDFLEVRQGLGPGDVVASGATFLLDSESRLKQPR